MPPKQPAAPANVSLLWCGSNPKQARNGWEFPNAVNAQLHADCAGATVLHMFGGRADFGTRMDIDASTRPHIIADAWLPPFSAGSFEIVILDPPYQGAFAVMGNQQIRELLIRAAWVASKQVIWFSTIWVESPARMKLQKGYVVRVGRSCAVRALQYFTVPPPGRKLVPNNYFSRGPALKYNRWLQQPEGLPFG